MQPVLAFFGVSPGETTVVLVAILLLFGAKRMPSIARSLGHAIGEFRKAARDLSAEVMRESLPEQLELPPDQKNSAEENEVYPETKLPASPEDPDRHAG